MIHKVTLPTRKVGVCYALLIKPLLVSFFEGILDIITYFHIFLKFGKELDNIKLTQGYFQQDGATHHMSTASKAMNQISSDKWRQGSVATIFIQLNPFGFLLVGLL